MRYKPKQTLRGATALLLALLNLFGFPVTRAGAATTVTVGKAAGDFVSSVHERAASVHVSAARVGGGSYGNLPLSFEANRGQTDSRVHFLSRGQGYTLFLTASEAVFKLKSAGGKAGSETGRNQRPSVLRMKFAGANPRARVEGSEQLVGASSYFKGRDRSKWVTGVTSFARVRYRDLYPGIDLVFYGAGQELEHDFVVAPGSDPRRIALSFEGADKVALGEDGNLVLSVGGQQITQSAPIIYQERDGARLPVEGAYVLKAKGRVAFRVGAYDRALPLVIDPITRIGYSTYLGGTSVAADNAAGVAVDSAGNAVVVGSTDSPNFPARNDDPDLEFGSREAFITKFNATGTDLIYSVYLGGKGTDEANAVALDPAGNAYVTGRTSSPDFPFTPGVVDEGIEEQNLEIIISDAFVTKLDTDGVIDYSTYLGGEDFDEGKGIAVDAAGRAYVTGATTSKRFPVKNEFQDGHFMDANLKDVFVTVLNSKATGYIYSSYFGGRSYDDGFGIALDSEGHAYITGQTDSDGTFPTKSPSGAGPFQERNAGGDDAFVAKFNPFAAGDASLVYSTLVGGRGTDKGFAIAVDDLNQAYVTGITGSVDFPLFAAPGAQILDTENVVNEAFVLSVDREGSALNFSTFFGGENEEFGTGIRLDSARNIYIAGSTASARNFPIVRAFQPAHGDGDEGVRDAFVAKLAPEGRDIIYSSYLGGTKRDDGTALAVDERGNAYVVGSTFSFDFPVTPDAFQTERADEGDNLSDAFVTKIGEMNPDTIGVYNLSLNQFQLRNTNDAGPADITQGFGIAGDIPIKGDWDGDGTDTIGIFRPSTAQFFLNNQNTDADAEEIISGFGQPGDLPLAGDFDGDGDDDVGFFRSGTFTLLVEIDGRSPVVFDFGRKGETPVAGDWDGDGIDTIGTFSNGLWSLRNSNTPGDPDITPFTFGDLAGDLPVTGDWDGDGTDTAGIFRAGQFFLNFQNGDADAELVFNFGVAGDLPLGGDWDGKP